MVRNYRVISISLDEGLLQLIDKITAGRRDCSRSNMIRLLLLRQLAQTDYLSDEEKEALKI
jgi:metal-responsive CopG/Arc/MetJ family transcriptional regulator